MSQDIISLLNKAKIDYSWSFSDKTRKDTAYITHGYHRYPAKFIPQVVSRLADKYTKEGYCETMIIKIFCYAKI